MTIKNAIEPVSQKFSDTPALYRNQDVLAGKLSNSFASHYIHSLDAMGRHVVGFSESSPGIVMTTPPHESGFRAWLKSDFVTVAKPDASPELIKKFCNDFDIEEENIRNVCTVGCGTNVILRLTEGLFYVTVQRTAPQKTDAGSLNSGAFSRAAGSSTGDIDLTAFRELNEELYIVANILGHATPISITPDAYKINQRQKEIILQNRRDLFPSILQAHGDGHIKLSGHYEIEGKCIAVQGLTEDVIERTFERDKILANRVFGHSPAQMDINGIDAIAVVDLPQLSINSILGVYDGEVNQNGQLLKREWHLKPLDQIYTEHLNGQIKMSPVPGRVVMAANDVRRAIDVHLGL